MTIATRTTITRARIIADTDPESPRGWSNVGTFVGFPHRRYNIGDREINADERTALEYGGWAGLERHLARQYGATVVIPVGMIDHSGVAYYPGGGPALGDAAGWDSGTCGFMFDSAESRAETGVQHFSYGHNPYGDDKPDPVRAALVSELETYSQWANGDVYGYVIGARELCELCEERDADDLPDDCPHCEIAEIDSCWGFYGSDPRTNGMIDSAGSIYRDALIDAAAHIEYRF